MNESRRIVPVSVIATSLVVCLVGLEVLVISGALELKGATVARIAPWAYEPFLKLVGEHPASQVNAKRNEASASSAPLSAMEVVASFNADALLAETNEVQEVEAAKPDPEPEEPAQEEPPKEVVPVG